MKLEIVKIIDKGTSEERLWLKVLAPVDLQYYIIFDTVYTSPTSISNLQHNAYWFAPTLVKPGDYIVLYTKKGKPSNTLNKNGTTTYFFYWGMDRILWNAQESCAVVFELSSWQTSKFGTE